MLAWRGCTDGTVHATPRRIGRDTHLVLVPIIMHELIEDDHATTVATNQVDSGGLRLC